jgi:hypothetical protein
MTAYWGVEAQLHAFFDLDIKRRLVVRFTPRPLYPQGKSPRFPLDRRLGGPQIRSGRRGDVIKGKEISIRPEVTVINC